MRKEEIDEFLDKNQKIAENIEKIAGKYKLSDFVKVDKPCKDYFQKEETDIGEIRGCLYNERESYLLLQPDSVEQRLTREYMDFICDIIDISNEHQKIFYIVAYHYLSLCKEIGYYLTEADKAPFRFLGEKISPLGQSNYEKYQKYQEGRLFNIIPWIIIDDLEYYNKIYNNFSSHYHSTKYFSLINYMIPCGYMVSSYEFDSEFEKRLDLFVFRYKAIYTTEFLFIYMDREAREKVINSLINI